MSETKHISTIWVADDAELRVRAYPASDTQSVAVDISDGDRFESVSTLYFTRQSARELRRCLTEALDEVSA